MTSTRIVFLFCVLFSWAGMAASRPWDPQRVISLAHDLYTEAWKTSAIAEGEFPGGAPGQDDLYRLKHSAQSFLLKLRKYPEDRLLTQKWFRPITWHEYGARQTMPACSPPYSNNVYIHFHKVGQNMQAIAEYYDLPPLEE